MVGAVANGSNTANAVNTHLAGEFFVTAELAKRGYTVALTMGNAKAVDLVASRNGASVAIQVKAIARASYSGWPLPFDKQKIIDDVIYVCVILNDLETPPSYFVLNPADVRAKGVWYSTRAILTVAKAKELAEENSWRIIEERLRASKLRLGLDVPG